MKGRLSVYVLVLIVMFGAVVVRLFYWQIIRGKELSQIARSQYQRNDLQGAPRGDILASDESFIVTNTNVYTAYAEPQLIDYTRSDMADKLADTFLSQREINEDEDKYKLLVEETGRINSLLNRREALWVPLSTKVTKQSKEKIDEFDFPGIGFEPISVRNYPEGSMAAQLLGFVGKGDNGEDLGYFGLEGYYELILTGKPGLLSDERDAAGRTLAIGDFNESAAINGANLITFVDKFIQITVEKKLEMAMERYGAKEGSVVVMDPETGGILAMASTPSYEPAKYEEYGNEYFRNPVVSDSFEPGSIFKVVVMASGLDAGVVEPETKCDICTGPFRIGKYSIGTWDDKYYADSVMTDVIKHSDNVGMIFVGNKLGKDKMYDYLSNFGFGSLTNIDLQGEMTPKLREKKEWGDVDLAITSFGQGIAVTPIQMIAAVNAIANDGLYVQPKVVKKIKGNGWEQEFSNDGSHRVVSKEAADEVTLMMAEAAKSGESKWTYREGFGVAGKTGTAQIPIAGKYDAEKTIASFIGFAPFDRPKFVMLVTLREPESSPWASETAAPLWYDIATELFTHFRMQPIN